MPNSASRPDPSSSASGSTASAASPFGSLEAGMAFFQDWMKAAGSALPNLQATQGPSGTGSGTWGMPTLDPEEIDKRIQELRTVQFWLEQNTRMIAMTIQGLEVQRMTLTTLRGMNVSMDAVRESLKARHAAEPSAPPPSPQPANEPTAKAAAEPAADATAEPTVNPMTWWNTLTEQFSQMASQAVQAAKVPAATTEAGKTTSRRPANSQKTTGGTGSARGAASTSSPASKTAARPAPKKAAAPRSKRGDGPTR